MAKVEDRFQRVYKQGIATVMEVWVDRETGVNYLFHMDGYGGGGNPQQGRGGKPRV